MPESLRPFVLANAYKLPHAGWGVRLFVTASDPAALADLVDTLNIARRGQKAVSGLAVMLPPLEERK